ncbi:MAG: ribonuclease III family protein [Candidatus Borkfalkiaceae bacterium]|nr:ribonuclease III family protein [Clostridia bacterium]MDY6222592.1 ribonuclease III family protein [Christensenellaceae bacterium]
MKKDDFSIAEAEKKIGYTFKNKRLLLQAFTHSTYANQYGGEDNERLEFLGDSVLQLIVTEELYTKKENLSEGDMTALRQKYVSGEALQTAVCKTGAEKLLLYSGKKENLGRKAVQSLFESVLAAIYLDGDGASGDGYANARAFVKKRLLCGGKENYKGALQEILQGAGKGLPHYETLSKTGAENAPVFLARVRAEDENGESISAEGKGASIKTAEEQAAKNLLEVLKKRRMNDGNGTSDR